MDSYNREAALGVRCRCGSVYKISRRNKSRQGNSTVFHRSARAVIRTTRTMSKRKVRASTSAATKASDLIEEIRSWSESGRDLGKGVEMGLFVEDEDSNIMRPVLLPEKTCGRICTKTNLVCHREGIVVGLARSADLPHAAKSGLTRKSVNQFG